MDWVRVCPECKGESMANTHLSQEVSVTWCPDCGYVERGDKYAMFKENKEPPQEADDERD